jgi:hypothetical protein
LSCGLTNERSQDLMGELESLKQRVRELQKIVEARRD